MGRRTRTRPVGFGSQSYQCEVVGLHGIELSDCVGLRPCHRDHNTKSVILP